jgi:NIPSNAP
MIIEVRTYQLKPASVAEVEKRFGDNLQAREKYSRLAAFWHTEVGPLNEIVHVWAYDSFEQRTTARKAAQESGAWPPPIRDFIVSMNSEIFIPAPFSPALEPRQVGPLFEIRSYYPRARWAARYDRTLGCQDRRAR